MIANSTEWVIQDLESGSMLDGEPDPALASVGRGWAWQPPGEPGTWRLRAPGDPRGATYRLVQVFGGPGHDPGWYENTIENLDTSEEL